MLMWGVGKDEMKGKHVLPTTILYIYICINHSSSPFSKALHGIFYLSQGVLLELIFDGVRRSQHNLEFQHATWRETVPKAKRWSFTSPALHLLTVSLKMAGQEVGEGWKKRKWTAKNKWGCAVFF